MQNTVIKHMLENDLLCLKDYQYNHDVPIESNEELNDLELKLRKEIAYVIAESYGYGTIRTYYFQFENPIVKKMKQQINRIFLPIGNSELKEGQLFIWAYFGAFAPYFFPNWEGQVDFIIREFWIAPDPEKCYVSEFAPIHHTGGPIKMKKHRSKKWKAGIKSR